jgi:predicted secreted protein
MYKRYLPIFFALIAFSCSRPSSEKASDSTATAPDTVQEQGNTDGDIFVTDSLKKIVNGDTTSAEEEGDDAEERMTSVHTSEIEPCGFSNDGKYFVFTQIVSGDYGSGGVESVFVIDVAKNEWAHKPVKLELNDLDYSYEDIKDTLRQKRDSVLAKYSIKMGNLGKVFELSANNKIVVNGQTYTLDLQAPNNLIDFHLKGNGKDIVLQKDKKLPASRGSVRAYRLLRAFVFGDKIAVFIEYDGDVVTGFENSRYYDRKYIAVTATVK